MHYPFGILTIDLDAIQANWRSLRARLAAGAECGAVVKANAYGLGMAPVAQALQQAGCKSFFVVTVTEGVELRRLLGEGADIFLLHGVPEGDEHVVADAQLIPVLSNLPMVQRWLAFCRAQALPQSRRRSVLKINTGMNRLGMEPAELTALLQSRQEFAELGCDVLMSHLACADEAAHPLNDHQLQAFEEVLACVRQQQPNIRASLANSAATLQGHKWHFDLVRPGISLYGSNPTGEPQHRMQPVVTLQLPVVQQRLVAPGSAVGYGATFVAEQNRHLVTVAGGYADGLFRSLGNSGCAWFKGALPIVGRVSMDSMVLDVSSLPVADRPQPGDLVELVGQNISVDAMGEAAGTVAYEVLTRFTGRYQRRYVLGGAVIEEESNT